MAKVQHNPRKDFRLPYSFFNMPLGTQIMYRLIRAHVDKFAKVSFPHQSVEYSRWCNVTHTYVRVIMTRTECKRVCDELYPTPIAGKTADIVIVDDLDG